MACDNRTCWKLSVLGRAAALGAAAAAAVVTSIGCRAYQNTPPEPFNAPPVVVDEAMQKRDWPMSVARYESGVTVAGPTGFYWEADPNLPPGLYAATATPVFIANVAAMPIVFLQTPPWDQVEYRAGTFPPTRTAMPPLPPSPGLAPMPHETFIQPLPRVPATGPMATMPTTRGTIMTPATRVSP